jgi:hypothetical protein
MTKSQAGKIVKQMLGSYPSLALHDPQTYIASICTLLSRYPLWAGENAIRHAIEGEESKFTPPTLGILRPLLEAEIKIVRYAAEWDRSAHSQVLLALEPPKDEPEVRKAYIAKRRAELGPTWGIASGKPRPPTREESRAALVVQIGQEAFDAMPDAGYDWTKLRAPQ